VLPRIIALLLVFSWITLSGFDVVEDLDLSDQIEFQSSTDGPLIDNGSTGVLAVNIDESSDYTPTRLPSLPEQFASATTVYTPHLFIKKISKLHKFHRVFLI
jgi:hypothetical protein